MCVSADTRDECLSAAKGRKGGGKVSTRWGEGRVLTKGRTETADGRHPSKTGLDEPVSKRKDLKFLRGCSNGDVTKIS